MNFMLLIMHQRRLESKIRKIMLGSLLDHYLGGIHQFMAGAWLFAAVEICSLSLVESVSVVVE